MFFVELLKKDVRCPEKFSSYDKAEKHGKKFGLQGVDFEVGIKLPAAR